MKKILIVEDDAFIQQALEDLLQAEDFQLLIADNGQIGYDVALKEHPDLILLDYFMPIKSGLDFLQELRQDDWGRTAQVIFLTNNNDTMVLNEALKNAVTDYLVKSDISGQALVDLVHQKVGA